MKEFLCSHVHVIKWVYRASDIVKLPTKVYFRRRAEGRRAEIISSRLGSDWHASVLDEECISVLKQLYWWYLIKDNFKIKENINNNLNN